MKTDNIARISSTELKNKLGDVLNRAAKETIIITQHNKDRFALIDMESYRLIREYAGKAFKAEDTPDELLELIELGIKQLEEKIEHEH